VDERLPELANSSVWREPVAGIDRLSSSAPISIACGQDRGELANRIVEVANKSIDPEVFFENLAGHAAFDAREDLPNVHVPTLVLHRPAFVGSHLDVARGLASRMPDARLVVVDGESVVPFIGDTSHVLDAIESFLDEDLARAAPPAEEARTAQEGAPAILFSISKRIDLIRR